MNAVEINGLTKFYGKSRGIVDLNLTVAEGEFFGFIGPNGAGKSTTVRTLLGLIKSSGGSAKIFGTDIAENKSKILAQTGYLPSLSFVYLYSFGLIGIVFHISVYNGIVNKDFEILVIARYRRLLHKMPTDNPLV